MVHDVGRRVISRTLFHVSKGCPVPWKWKGKGLRRTLARSSTSNRSSRMTCPLSKIASAGVCWEYVLTRQNIVLYCLTEERPMTELALQPSCCVNYRNKFSIAHIAGHSVSHEDRTMK